MMRKDRTYDSELGVVLGVVNTDNEHGGISGRSRDDDLLGATLQVEGSPGQSQDISR